MEKENFLALQAMIQAKKRFFATCFYLFWAVNLIFAQKTINFEHLSVEDGLSHHYVSAILQDKKGFIWLGTQDGLNRFDGYEVRPFRHNPQNANTLSNNYIWAIAEDPKRNIWIATNNGLNRYDPVSQEFRAFYAYDDNPQALPNSQTYSLLCDRNGEVWAGTESGIGRYSPEKQGFTRYQINPKREGSNAVYALYQTRKGEVLAGSFGFGLKIFDKDKSQFVPYPNYSFEKDYVHAIYEDRKGNLWIGTNEGLRMKPVGKTDFVAVAEVNDQEINTIAEDHEGKILIGTVNGGLNIYDPKNQSFSFFQNDFNEGSSLAHDNVEAIFTDKSGITWLGTANGASYYDPTKYRFKLYQHETDNDNSLNDSFVWSVYEDKEGILWIGTKGGLNRLDRKTRTFTVYKKSANTPSISDNHVICIIPASKGGLWLGTSKGLTHFDPQKNTFKNYFSQAEKGNALSDNHIISLYEDRKGILWVGTIAGGLNKFDPQTEKWKVYKNDPNDTRSISDNMVRAIIEDQKGNLWIGTAGGGLNILDKKEDLFTVFKHSPEDPKSLKHNSVKYLFVSKNGTLWVGTHGGLDKYLPENQGFENYNVTHGLPDNNVHGILEDTNGNLWLSTNKGISQYRMKDKTFENYDLFDNLQGAEFNNGACFRNIDGEMFFGGVNGLNSFFPSEISNNKFLAEIVLTDIRIESETEWDRMKVFGGKDISETNVLYLPSDQNSFSLQLAVLSFRDPEKNIFQYQLEGHDKTWKKGNPTGWLSFTNLSPKTYLLHIKAANSDGFWNENIKTIRIVIDPPIWATWWFSGFIIIGAVVAFIFAYQFRINLVEKQRDKLEQQIRERVQEIEEQKLKVEKSFQNIRVISEIGQKITALLHHDLVITTVFDSVRNLMDVSMFRIGIYDPQTEMISFEGFTNQERIEAYKYSKSNKQHLSMWCIKHKKEIFFNDFDNDYPRHTGFPIDTSRQERPQSLIYVPLMVEENPIGILTVQSFQKDVYTEEHLNIIRALASYTSIAMDNTLAYNQLQSANVIIAQKNENILSSIRYAERIQRAILPRPEAMQVCLKEYFVIFQAKDIVSGDFYWFKREKQYIYLAAIDCTGHGVPGAFMSMIGNTLLNEIVNNNIGIQPSKILEELHMGIREALKQENNMNDDGMDIALCRLEENKRDLVLFSGAKRPIFHYSKGEVHEIRGDRKTIGGKQKEEYRTFTDSEIAVEADDVIYLTSDGIIDQPNDHKVKLMTVGFKALIAQLGNLPIAEQKERIWQNFLNHKGEQPQRDDVTVIGVKI